MTVAEPGMPRRLVALARFDALIFLQWGLVWLRTAGVLAALIARRALGQVGLSPVLTVPSLVSMCLGLLLTPFTLNLVGAREARSCYNTAVANKDVEEPLKTRRQIVGEMLKDPFMFGNFVFSAFMMIAIDYDFMVGLLRLEGCQRVCIGLLVRDVALMGAGSACCFIILPSMALMQWRMK